MLMISPVFDRLRIFKMRFVIFDLEATCWDGHSLGRQQEIIEIGAVLTDHFGTSHATFQSFVRPIVHPDLSHYCTDLTGITQDDVRSAAVFEDVVGMFQDWIDIYDSGYVLCSWGDKDKDLLMADCSRHGVETDWLAPYIDLKAQYHELKGLRRKRGLKRTLQHEQMEFEGDHHRALDDAANLFGLFAKYRDSWMY